MAELEDEFEDFSKMSTRKRIDGMDETTKKDLGYYVAKLKAYSPEPGYAELSSFINNSGLSAGTKAVLAHGLGRFLYTMRRMTKDEFELIKSSFRHPSTSWSKKEISKEQMLAIIKESANFVNKLAIARNPLLVAFFCTTGARVSQLVDLDEKDIDIEGDTMTIKLRRMKETRNGLVEEVDAKDIPMSIKLGPWMLSDIYDDYMEVRKNYPPGPLFVNAFGNRITRIAILQFVKQMGERVGVKNFTCHSFRHYVATTTVVNHGIAQAAVLLGHANIATTQKYVMRESISTRELACSYE